MKLKLVRSEYIGIADMAADGLTKALLLVKFKEFIQTLNLHDQYCDIVSAVNKYLRANNTI